jgi:alcohol dehydrogenase class IV
LKEQNFIASGCTWEKLWETLAAGGVSRPMLVCGKSLERYPLWTSLEQGGAAVVFREFTSNPQIEDVKQGVKLFRQHNCDSLISIGGGTAIDIAKCVKAFQGVAEGDWGEDLPPVEENQVFHIAVPTTAGTGSESTTFAVVYKDGIKRSVEHVSLLPDAVFLDGTLLRYLPEYQKKATFLDAVCQAVESMWAVNATEESQRFAEESLRLLLRYKDLYFSRDEEVNQPVLEAANYSGRAICISKTTAAHAMSYPLTSLYHVAHGHGVAMMLPLTLEKLLCSDLTAETKGALAKLEDLFGAADGGALLRKVEDFLESFQMPFPKDAKLEDLPLLLKGVNPQRLGNFPEALTRQELEEIYRKALRLS